MDSLTAINPLRISTGDDPLEILRFAAAEARLGGAAIATLVEIRGGAARSLGAHVAVAADGRFCGYVSGGCVEAAVASEALSAMTEGRDRTVMFGEGSPFFDIVLPCGGGITVSIHVVRQPDVLDHVISRLESRETAGLEYCQCKERIVSAEKPVFRAGLKNGVMHTVYRPRTRIIISGQSGEAQMLQRLAEASNLDVRLVSPGQTPADTASWIDPYSAVVLLHHDIDAEGAVLEAALSSRAFYIGALGSTRTHRRRLERLQQADYPSEILDRIKAPIGLFGPTRDATSLALSVLADVAATRLEAFP